MPGAPPRSRRPRTLSRAAPAATARSIASCDASAIAASRPPVPRWKTRSTSPLTEAIAAPIAFATSEWSGRRTSLTPGGPRARAARRRPRRRGARARARSSPGRSRPRASCRSVRSSDGEELGVVGRAASGRRGLGTVLRATPASVSVGGRTAEDERLLSDPVAHALGAERRPRCTIVPPPSAIVTRSGIRKFVRIPPISTPNDDSRGKPRTSTPTSVEVPPTSTTMRVGSAGEVGGAADAVRRAAADRQHREADRELQVHERAVVLGEEGDGPQAVALERPARSRSSRPGRRR